MADKLALIQEAARRGILPEDKRPLYEEAVRRGLIKAPEAPQEEAPGFVAETASNLLPSAGRFAKDIYQAVRHPVKTGAAIAGLGASALANNPVAASMAEARAQDPEEGPVISQTSPEILNAVKQFYTDRYGSLEGLEQTIRKDPVGFLADLSTVFTGGAAVAGKIPGAARVAGGLQKAAAVTDPLTIAARGAATVGKPLAKGATKLGAEAIGAVTGAGPEAVRQAAKGAPEFAEGLRGKTAPEELLGQAKDALSTVKQKRSDAYRAELAEIAKNNRPLSAEPIRAKVSELMKRFNIRQSPDGSLDFSRSSLDTAAHGKAEEIVNTVADWGREADDLTPLGLDLLKRRLDDFYSESSRGLGALVTDLRNTVKSTIVKEVPAYARMTRDYEKSTRFIDEASRALSLNDRAMMDTAIKKILSTQRENFEFRRELLSSLEQISGKDMSPAIAGVSMSQVIPKGLVGKGLGASMLYGGTINPALFGMAAVASPRLAGELLHNILGVPRREAAKIVGSPEFRRVAQSVTKGTSRPVRQTAFQAGRQAEEEEAQ